MPRTLSLRKKLLFSTVLLTMTYAVLEAAATTWAWFSWWDTSFWLYEDSGRTWRFDATRGYHLGRTPSRFLRSTNGRLEYVGTARGNSQGFADRDDFEPNRTIPGRKRLIVFGDSFTEAQFLGQNWPDRVEDLSRERRQPVELLNMAISGGGLANWWSVLTRLVEPDGYEADGVIFAVFASDLDRKFSVWDHREGGHPLFGRSRQWDPSTIPTTFEEARTFLEPHPSLILSPEDFERSLQGQWPRGIPRHLRPFFMTQAWRALRYGPSEPSLAAPERTPDPMRDRLVAEIGQVLAKRHWPALVVLIPDRPGLLQPSKAGWQKREAEAFARAVGATFLDGGQIFEGMTPAQIRAQFLPHDGHWNQAGSNRFAEFMVHYLDRFPPGS